MNSAVVRGCAIYANATDINEIIIRGVNIYNCECYSEEGGGIYVEINENSSFIIENSTDKQITIEKYVAGPNTYNYERIWEEHQGSVGDGRGGGIFIYLKSTPKTIKVVCVFGTEEGRKNEATEGYDLFIYENNMSGIVNFDNFPCLNGKDDNYNGAMGYDVSVLEGKNHFISNICSYIKNGGALDDYPDVDNPDDENPVDDKPDNNSPDNDNPDNDNGNKFPIWAIILIVVLVVVIIAVVVIVVIVCVVVRKKRGDGKNVEMDEGKKEEINAY